MKFIDSKSNNPYYNLALEEYILKNFKDEDYLFLWQNEPSLIDQVL